MSQKKDRRLPTDEGKLWELFFATGLPEVYLALRAVNRDGAKWQDEPALTAFVPRPEEKEES